MGSNASKQSIQTQKDNSKILGNSSQQQKMLEQLSQSQIDLTRKLNSIESASNAARDSLTQDISSIRQEFLGNMTSSKIKETNVDIDIEDRIKESESKIIQEYNSQIAQQSEQTTGRIAETEVKLASIEEELGKNQSFMNEAIQTVHQIQRSIYSQKELMNEKIIVEIHEQLAKEVTPTMSNLMRLQAEFLTQSSKIEALETTLKNFLAAKEKDTQQEKQRQQQLQETIKNLEVISSIIDRQAQTIQETDYAKNSETKEIRKQLLEVKAELARLEKKVLQPESSSVSKELVGSEDSGKKPQLNITKGSLKTEQKDNSKLKISPLKISISIEDEDISLDNLPSKFKPISKKSQAKENFQYSSILQPQNATSELTMTKNTSSQQLPFEDITPRNQNSSNSDVATLKMEQAKQDSIKALLMLSGMSPPSSVTRASRKSNSPITSEESFSSKVQPKRSKRNTRSKLE